MAPVRLSKQSLSSSVAANWCSAVALWAPCEAPLASSGSSLDWRIFPPLPFSVASWRTSFVLGLSLLEFIACGGSCSWGLRSLGILTPGDPRPDLALAWKAVGELLLLLDRVSPAALAAPSTFGSRRLSLYSPSSRSLPLSAGLSCVAPCPFTIPLTLVAIASFSSSSTCWNLAVVSTWGRAWLGTRSASPRSGGRQDLNGSPSHWPSAGGGS